ncbi:MAG: hypothetical protein GF331_24885 [Chitinivibrionales bacterium]|nr:hypothetical protein [Chitinivibrionales bacterium]
MNSRRFFQRRRHDLLYVLLLLMHAVVFVLPRRPGLRLFGLLGRIVFVFGGRERTRTLEHLRYIYGEQWNETRIRRTARAVFVHLAKTLFDAVKLPRLSDARFFRIVKHDPVEQARAAYERGRGLIVVTAHLGCFEMLLPFFARMGFRSFAVGRHMFDPRIERMVARNRSGTNMEYVSRADNPREILRRLKRGMAFGVLVDQDTDVDGVFAHFLGRPAYTPSGIVRLAMRYDIPLIVATTIRLPDETHRVSLSEPLTLRTGGDPDTDLVLNVERINEIIGTAIRQAPEQWVWMHRRWRRTPETPGLNATPHIERLAPADTPRRHRGSSAR